MSEQERDDLRNEQYSPSRGHAPEPEPDDTCTGCGRQRDELPGDEGLHIEVLHGDGSADWLCSRCDDRGRGLK